MTVVKVLYGTHDELTEIVDKAKNMNSCGSWTNECTISVVFNTGGEAAKFYNKMLKEEYECSI